MDSCCDILGDYCGTGIFWLFIFYVYGFMVCNFIIVVSIPELCFQVEGHMLYFLNEETNEYILDH